MNVVDSSAWLEYFADGPNAAFFARAIEDSEHLVVPTITIYEVFKRVLVQRDHATALQAVAQMRQGDAVPLTDTLALQAAATSAARSLPMADAIVFATARVHGATVWTQDVDFEGLEGVQYRAKVVP